MEVVKVITKRYKVMSAVDKPFMRFGMYRSGRQDIGLSFEDKCFNCNHVFDNEENVYHVILQGALNHLFCKKCNDMALLDLPKGDKK